MPFLQSVSGSEVIPISIGYAYDYAMHSLEAIYYNITAANKLTGDHLLLAKLMYAPSYGQPCYYYRVNLIPINSDIHLYTCEYLNDHHYAEIDESVYGNAIFLDISPGRVKNYEYGGSSGSTGGFDKKTFGNISLNYVNPQISGVTYTDYPSYAYTPNWENANGAYTVYFNEALPVILNYKPVDRIFGKGNSLKLSMIKEEYTLGGKDMLNVSTEYIQRFTDETNLYSILSSMGLNDAKIIGYTDDNNYVRLCKTFSGQYQQTGVLQYFINNKHNTDLDFEFTEVYDDPDAALYLSYLVDVEHSIARQSLIKLYSDTNEVTYNMFENGRVIVTDEYKEIMFIWLSSSITITEPETPQEQGGTSNTGGGNGSYSNIGDNISLPLKPNVSAVDADFITVYNPTLSQIKSLAKYMWGNGFNIESFKKIFTDPMDCIIGLHIVPCYIPNNGMRNVKVGNLESPVVMNLASEQFVDVDCGSIKINEYWGSYLDYSPYTKIIIYLPYIGTQALEVDDVMNKTVRVVYRIDIITGACTCFILVDDIVMYQYNGTCSATVPISSQDYRSTVSSIITMGSAAGTLGATMVTGGAATIPMVAGAQKAFTSGVMNSKPTIAHGNTAGGAGGFMSVQYPYITITRARQCLPKNQNKYTGYPSYITSQLAELKGFTQIEEIHLESITCTEVERTEIESLLKGGVII